MDQMAVLKKKEKIRLIRVFKDGKWRGFLLEVRSLRSEVGKTLWDNRDVPVCPTSEISQFKGNNWL
jgi:hypothetical protein